MLATTYSQRRFARACALATAIVAAAIGFMVDATPSFATHTVMITDGPSGETEATSATFTFTSSVTSNFSCKLDGAAFAACGDPISTGGSITYDNLAVGEHTFTVLAIKYLDPMDIAADSRTWNVVTPAPPPDPGPAPPPDPTTGPIDQGGATEAIHGPEIFRPKDMLEKNEPDLDPQEGTDEQGQAPPATSSSLAAPAGTGTGTGTSSLTAGPFTIPTTDIDPQIAASSTHLVVANQAGGSGYLRYFTKAGTDITTDRTGKPIAEAYDLRWFFHDLFDPGPNSINKGLNLPGTLECTPNVNPIDVDADKKITNPITGKLYRPRDVEDCVKEVYDARVLYDTWRERFVIIALVRNGTAGPSYMGTQYPPEERVGRRTRVAIAYSSSDDPRDKWYTWWVNGEYGSGECNTIEPFQDAEHIGICPGGKYRPGEATDYPRLGVSADGIQIALSIVARNPYTFNTNDPVKYPNGEFPVDGAVSWDRLITLPAEPLASGSGGQAKGYSWNRFSIAGSTGLPGYYHPYTSTPIVQQAPSDTGAAYWLSLDDLNNRLILIEHDHSRPNAPLTTYAFPVKPYRQQKVQSAAQPDGSGGIEFTKLSNQIHTAIQQGNEVFAAWPVCDAAVPTISCDSLVKVVRFHLSFLPDPAVTWDHVIGAGSEDISYGWPAIAVTNNTLAPDAVISYNRVGPTVPVEAAYSVWDGIDAAPGPDQVLQAGSGIVSSDMYLHNATSAAEPGPDGGIWLYNTYAVNGTYNYAFGKVLGTAAPDYDYSKFNTKSTRTRTSVVISVANTGDDDGIGTKLGWSLKGRGSCGGARAGAEPRAARSGKVQIKSVESGEQRTVQFSIPTTGFGPGSYLLTVRIAAGEDEYSAENNVIKQRVRISGRCP